MIGLGRGARAREGAKRRKEKLEINVREARRVDLQGPNGPQCRRQQECPERAEESQTGELVSHSWPWQSSEVRKWRM